MSNGQKNLIVLLVIAGLTAGGAWLYTRYDEDMASSSGESARWPSVDGLVTRSNLEALHSNVGTNRKIRWRLEIYYEYVVGNEVFENDVVRFDQDELSTEEKEDMVSAYPVGRRVHVFYNPERPKQSVLVRNSWR